MSDFPPNPEDGELWLPSYIIQEISTRSSTVTAHPKPPNRSTSKNKVVFPPHLTRINNPQESKSNLVEICFGSFGTINGANNNKVAPPAPVISFHKPVTPTTTIIQGFKGRKSKAGIGTGTGVFLPLSNSMNVITKKPEEIRGGTGVFHNHKEIVICQSKKTSDNEDDEEVLEMNNNTRKYFPIIQEENFGNPENYQHESGICLPEDWTY